MFLFALVITGIIVAIYYYGPKQLEVKYIMVGPPIPKTTNAATEDQGIALGTLIATVFAIVFFLTLVATLTYEWYNKRKLRTAEKDDLINENNQIIKLIREGKQALASATDPKEIKELTKQVEMYTSRQHDIVLEFLRRSNIERMEKVQAEQENPKKRFRFGFGKNKSE